jgi:UDP-N-acetylmuramoyl-tripeptide--D-alanyl-D-alanine ligase
VYSICINYTNQMLNALKEGMKEARIWLIQWQAARILRKYQPIVIAITGSVGKTSTKDAIYTGIKDALERAGTSVRKNIKSYNGELGTPLTILGCEVDRNSFGEWLKTFFTGFALLLWEHSYPDYLVLEVGLGRPNELRKIASWLHPDISVITALSKVPVHVEYFPTVEALIEEKSTLAKAVKPTGTLILNADDEQVLSFANLTPAKKILYGENPKADFRAQNFHTLYAVSDTTDTGKGRTGAGNGQPHGIGFTAVTPAAGAHGQSDGRSFEIELDGSLGSQHVYPVLAALAVAEACGLPLETAAKSLGSHSTTPGRMRIIEGINVSTIIDDSYNSSPVALTQSLKTLKELKTSGQKIALLGDMRELGLYTKEAHEKGGIEAVQAADIIIGVGPNTRTLLDSAIAAGFPKEKTAHFLDSVEAANYLKPLIQPGDIILAKGSQNTIRLERAVKALMAHPEQAAELLIRQGEFWEKR